MSAGTLGARVAGLERSARRDRAVALGALALVLATAQAPASTPLVVRDDGGGTVTLSAGGLAVRDSSRTERGAIGFDPARSIVVELYDASGAVRQAMAVVADRPLLRQLDKSGQARAELYLNGDARGEFHIRDASGVTRAAAFIGDQGRPELSFYGTDGKQRAYVSTLDTSAFLVMKDKAGVSRVTIGTYQSGRVGIDVRNAAGLATWIKP